VRAGDTVYLSGQVPLDPATTQLVSGASRCRCRRVFENLKAVAEAAGGSLAHHVKMNVYLTDLANFGKVNEIMASYCSKPYPARAVVRQPAAAWRGRSRSSASCTWAEPQVPAAAADPPRGARRAAPV